MKILYIAGDTKFGGGVHRTASLVRRANRLGWQADVLVTNPIVQRAMREAGAGIIDLDVVRREMRPWRDLWGLYRLYRFLRESDYTIVHTSTSKGGFLGRLASRLAGVPVVVHTVAGFAFHEESGPITLHAFSTLEKLAAQWCDRIYTVSEYHRQWALRLGIGNEDLVKAIPSGIPVERVSASRSRDEVRSELGLEGNELAILAAGRLAPQKGLEYLIDAVPLLAERTEFAFKILLAGEGNLRSELQAQAARLDLQERVLFLGYRDDVADLLAASDIVVLPSLWEGLSISVLEAMAAAKPIVTTTIGSNREALVDGETGLLVPVKRPDLLAQAILILAGDSDLRLRLATAARQVYEERFTIGRMVDEYEAEYVALCAEKGTHS